MSNAEGKEGFVPAAPGWVLHWIDDEELYRCEPIVAWACYQGAWSSDGQTWADPVPARGQIEQAEMYVIEGPTGGFNSGPVYENGQLVEPFTDPKEWAEWWMEKMRKQREASQSVTIDIERAPSPGDPPPIFGPKVARWSLGSKVSVRWWERDGYTLSSAIEVIGEGSVTGIKHAGVKGWEIYVTLRGPTGEEFTKTFAEHQVESV